MSRVKKVKVVYATWCPHCVPTAVQPMKEVAKQLGAELVLLDIDKSMEEADALVREHGDWSEDYIVPQIFFEYSDGRTKHILTGYSEAVEMTRKGIENLRSSSFYSALRA